MKVINARAVKVTRHVHVICCSKPVSSSRFWLPAAHAMSEKTKTRRGRGRVHCRPASNAEPLPPTSERRTEEVAALAGPASAPGPHGSVAPSSPEVLPGGCRARRLARPGGAGHGGNRGSASRHRASLGYRRDRSGYRSCLRRSCSLSWDGTDTGGVRPQILTQPSCRRGRGGGAQSRRDACAAAETGGRAASLKRSLIVFHASKRN